MTTPVILWFRRDLRLADNPALVAAAATGPVIPLFVIDPVFFATAGHARQAFLVDGLRALGRSIGGRLVVRHGDPAVVVAAVVAETGARLVLAAHDYGPYGTRRDAAVTAGLSSSGAALTFVDSAYAVAPGTVVKADGSPYAVFTPFRRAWEQAGWRSPVPAPDEVEWLGDPEVAGEGYPTVLAPAATLPPAGEDAADQLMEEFLARRVDGYAEARDRPAVDGTSRLSPYLRFGMIHPRQLLARLGDDPDQATFRSELCWREFYADVLHRRPETAWAPLRPELAGLVVDTDAGANDRFAAWCRGETGYPIVDAGMRQLLATGWMHNRVRMITASFLVKDLHLPWQWGARHFMRLLVDGDLASNNHGWQWAAGTGTDAAPYFRVFNPVLQGERFDPDGSYVRRWIPELAGLADRDVHQPWRSGRGQPLGYPGPMVDHGVERAEALARFAAATRAPR